MQENALGERGEAFTRMGPFLGSDLNVGPLTCIMASPAGITDQIV